MRNINLKDRNEKLHTGMKPMRNYNAKPPKIGGGLGRKAPSIISKALGTAPGLPVHQASVSKLLNHPDKSIASAAKKLMSKY